MLYRRCGASGLKLLAVSLGPCRYFGLDCNQDGKRKICRTAFDHGITHFDLAIMWLNIFMRYSPTRTILGGGVMGLAHLFPKARQEFAKLMSAYMVRRLTLT